MFRQPYRRSAYPVPLRVRASSGACIDDGCLWFVPSTSIFFNQLNEIAHLHAVTIVLSNDRVNISAGTESHLPNSLNCPAHHPVILQLGRLVSTGDQDLWAGMIKRHQQAIIPATNPARVILQGEVMIVKQF